jgi:excisionase family DNA binding protein
MPALENYLTVTEAAAELGLSASALRSAINYGSLRPVRLDKTSRINLISREEVERYRREHLGRRGKRMLPDEALTEQQRKQRTYQQAYYQRRQAARKQQPATDPAENKE